MQVTSINNNTNFGSLRISHNAFDRRLRHLHFKELLSYNEIGEKLRQSEKFDLDIMEDLSMRISKKCDKNFSITKLISVKFPKADETELDIVCATGKRRNDTINTTLKFYSHEAARVAYNNLTKKEGIEQMYYLTKYMDKTACRKGEDLSDDINRKPFLLDALYNKFSDFI